MLKPLSSRLRPVVAALMLLPLHAAWAVVDVPALEKLEKQVQAVAEKNMPAVVALTHGDKSGIASGSGVIISKNGLLVTAAHVVNEADIVTVTFVDGKTVRAKVLGANYDRDVAMAIITEPGTYPFAELGDTKNLATGEMVVAMGHPGGFDPRRKPPVRFGRVFNFNRDRFIRSDCTLVGGDSGGPLFDLAGKVIGVHSSVSTGMSDNHDAPVDALRKDWDRLIMGERWGRNPLSADLPKLSEKELGGLNLEKLRERVLAEGMKGKGALAATPDSISQWLKDCGMSEERLKSLDPAAMMDLMGKALGGMARIRGEEMEAGDAPKVSEEELAGLDTEKLRKRMLEEGMKNGGALKMTPDDMSKWFAECGMSEEKLKKLDLAQMQKVLKKVMGSGIRMRTESGAYAAPAIVQQDKEVVAAVKPALDKLTPSVVTLMDGDKTLALGTVIRASGFILTKHSEIAKSKGQLKVRLASGVILPGVEVQQFADHDLALVKVGAEAMPAVTIPEQSEPMALGQLLFTPSNKASDSMLAMGVVSVKDRSLKESGGYLGVGLSQGDEGVEVGQIVPDGPAAKAGLAAKDRILSVNDQAIATADALSVLIRSMKPEDKVQVKIRRGQEEKTLEIALGDRSKLASKGAKVNPMIAIGTDVSDQANGFPLIFQHDQPLRPQECGGVIADLHGKIVGVNIARAGRVNTYAIPAGTVAELLKTVDFEALEKKAAEKPENKQS